VLSKEQRLPHARYSHRVCISESKYSGRRTERRRQVKGLVMVGCTTSRCVLPAAELGDPERKDAQVLQVEAGVVGRVGVVHEVLAVQVDVMKVHPLLLQARQHRRARAKQRAGRLPAPLQMQPRELGERLARAYESAMLPRAARWARFTTDGLAALFSPEGVKGALRLYDSL
jgi:hypothetical protein